LKIESNLAVIVTNGKSKDIEIFPDGKLRQIPVR